MEKKFTPGPWEILRAYSPNTRNEQLGVKAVATKTDIEPYNAVCLVSECATETTEDRANAVLIAAAPDLLEALQEAVRILRMSNISDIDDYDIITKSEAAISKALQP